MRFPRIYLIITKLILAVNLLFPIAAFAHLISITATIPFPATVHGLSTTTATFTITNITSRVTLTAVDQSQFPSGSGLSIVSSTCGNPIGPGQTCNIIIQLRAPSTPQIISAQLSEWAKPSIDHVCFPFTIAIVGPQQFVAVGESFDNSFNNNLPLAYTSSNEGINWTLSPAFSLPSGQPQGSLASIICINNNCTVVGESFDNSFNNNLPLAYTSNDGGGHWILSAVLPLPTGQTQGQLFGVTCIGSICTGVGVSYNDSFTNNLPLAYISNDGGVNWTLSSALPLPTGQTQGILNSVICPTNHCVAVGESFGNSFTNNLPLAYTSNDGGVNWTLSSVFSLPSGQTQGQLLGVTCIGSFCIAAGESSDNSGNSFPVAYASNDGGVNWTLLSTFPMPIARPFGELHGVTCIGSSCIAVGQSFDSGFTSRFPLVYTSNDGGINWTLSSSLLLPNGQVQGTLNSVICINNSNCVTVGESFDVNLNNRLPLAYASSDGGVNWTLSSALPLPTGQTQGELFGVGSSATGLAPFL